MLPQVLLSCLSCVLILAISQIQPSVSSPFPSEELISYEDDLYPAQNADDFILRQYEKRSRQRQAGFSSWAGKRSGDRGMGFSSWAGKRSGRGQQAFSAWAGKRAPFNSWAGKRSGEAVIYHDLER